MTDDVLVLHVYGCVYCADKNAETRNYAKRTRALYSWLTKKIGIPGVGEYSDIGSGHFWGSKF